MDTVLVVDDKVNYLIVIKDLLREAGYEVITASSAIEALKIARASDLDLVLTEMKMPKMSGIELLDYLHRLYPDLPVIIMTAFGTVETAVTAIKKGAFDYILKPIRCEILVTIAKALEHRHILLENKLLNQKLEEKHSFPNIVGDSRPMQEILALVKRVAQSQATMLITGESGTGKDLIAIAIHQCSHMAHKRLVLANSLLGYDRSAFTKKLADVGTLFINELADMSLELQGEILWLLQEMEFKVGGTRNTPKMDIRVVGASNRDLKKEVEAGRFREDLFYRLNVVHLHLPPLRQRKEDIPLLVAHFINKYAQENFKGKMRITPEALRMLTQYAWPGNVRELENFMERAVVMCINDLIAPSDLPAELVHAPHKPEVEIVHLLPLSTPLPGALESIEKEMIRRALEQSGRVQVRAAEILGITKSLLQYKM
jgi:two-component system NtrC family response regulator